MMAIDGALQHTTIERLKRTWAHVTEKDKHVLKALKAFTNPAFNYQSYRNVQNNTRGFCIPYM
jgi:RNA binding exosome subunit